MSTLLQDIRYGLRMLAKAPGFTVIAVLTLALGIGANTALFSIVNGVLLNPLPFPHPEQLVTLHESKPNFPTGSISYPNFRDWQKENHTFSGMAIARGFNFNLTGNGPAEQIRGGFVSSDFFQVLGVKPAIGRLLAPGEDQIGAAPVALLGGGFWKRKFAGSPAILGKNIALDGKDYRVIGVIPANYDLNLPNLRVSDVYVPIGQWDIPWLKNRGAGLGIHGVGRLKPGVTPAQAQADMDSLTRALAAAYPSDDKDVGASMIPLREQLLGKVQPFLLVLLGAVGFVLLIACVNVANLLLARSTARAREFAVRAALGASKTRLIRQVVTESILLAIVGGASGLLVAEWGTQAALSALPAAIPRTGSIHIDGRVLLFTMAASLLAGLIFGLVPALRLSQMNPQTALQSGGRGSSGARHRAQSVFVVMETAMALVLLIGAGLMIRSLARLWGVNPGFNANNVMAFGLSLPPSFTHASADAIRADLRQIDDRMKSVPGIKAVSLSFASFPMAGDDEQLFWFEGQPKPTSQSDMNWALRYVIEPGYLQAMEISLERGRFFTEQDNEHAPLVAVVDDVFAQKFFGNQNPIGKRINLQGPNKPAEIIGIVGHVRHWGLDSDDSEALRAQIYLPYMQLGDDDLALVPPGTTSVVRYSGSATAVFNALRNSLQKMNPDNVVYGAQTMDDIIARSLATRRFSMMILAIFAALALLLAAIGIYGVISYVAGQRTHEIGVRMALGAQQREILQLILGQAARVALIGVAIGLGAAFALTRLMSSLLYGVKATDPLTFAAVAVLLILVALAACYIPARRAMRVDPMVALRYE
jgi:putative ABC transport system permease protein